jgi:DNA-binding transcriptional ArsR family regulator
VDTISQGRDLAALAGLLADDSRATFCMLLLDGRAWTAGELARHAGIAASTASDHLTKLVAGGILAEHRQGRHRYLALADARVAQMLEDLTAHLEPAGEHPRTLRAAHVAAALAGARTCYDHLAGRLGVAIADAMTRKGLIDQADGIALTEAGGAWLASELAIDVEALRAARRPLVRVCVDWTERRPHLAGSAGAEICRRFQERGWIRRIDAGRAMLVTPPGRSALHDLLGIDTAAIA